MIQRRLARSGIALGALVLAAASATTPASGQIATAQDCARKSSQAEELACLREALARSEAARRGDESVQAATPPQTRSAEVSQQAQPMPAAPAPPPVRTASRPAQQLGDEQLPSVAAEADRNAVERAQIHAAVTTAKADPRGGLTLWLDNGQVWQQAEQPGVPLSLAQDKPHPVEITRSGFGGYRMRFADSGRKIVVKRLQ